MFEVVRTAPSAYASSLTYSPSTVLAFKPCPVELFINIAQNDKQTMVQEFAKKCNNEDALFERLDQPETLDGAEEDDALPLLRFNSDDAQNWTKITTPFSYLYAGKGPYVGR